MNFFRDTEGTFFLPVRKVFHWLPQFTPLRMIKHPNLFKAVRYVLYVSSLLIYYLCYTDTDTDTGIGYDMYRIRGYTISRKTLIRGYG